MAQRPSRGARAGARAAHRACGAAAGRTSRSDALGALLLSGVVRAALSLRMDVLLGRSACGAVDGSMGKAVLQSVLVGLEAGRQSRRAELDKPGAGSSAKVVRVRCSWDSAPAPRVVVASRNDANAIEAGAALAELRMPPGADPPSCEVSVAFAAETRVDCLMCVASAKQAEVLLDDSYVTTVRGRAVEDESGLFSHYLCFASRGSAGSRGFAQPLCTVLTVRFLSLQGGDKGLLRLGPLYVDALSGRRADEESAGEERAGLGTAASAQSESLTSLGALNESSTLLLVARSVEALSQRVGALELALQRQAAETSAKLDRILAVLDAANSAATAAER